MTPSERDELLSAWMRRSSDDEQEQQARAERMVCDAITRWDAFAATPPKVYAKGSYPNNTNVRRDSDVDVAVEATDCHYLEYAPGVVPHYATTPYAGPWKADVWRTEVGRALRGLFGVSVDTSGAVAIHIPGVAGSRPPIDVVPTFPYRYYLSGDRSSAHEGSCVFPTKGQMIVNYPAQQLLNGRAKNERTGRRYKRFVRALKRAENELVRQGTIKPLPSYFMECLIYNVDDTVLTIVDVGEAFRQALMWLSRHLNDDYVYERWLEPNGIKYLFHPKQKWSRDDAKRLVNQTYTLLGY